MRILSVEEITKIEGGRSPCVACTYVLGIGGGAVAGGISGARLGTMIGAFGGPAGAFGGAVIGGLAGWAIAYQRAN